MPTTRNTLITALLLHLVTTSFSVMADEFPWTLRGYGAYIKVLDATGTNDASADIRIATVTNYTIELDKGTGLGFALERRFLDQRLGVEFSSMLATINTNLDINVTGSPGQNKDEIKIDSDFAPISLGLNYHLLKSNERYDIYAGAFYSYVHYEDSDVSLLSSRTQITIEDDNTYGFNLGFDASLGLNKRWLVTTGIRYILTKTEFGFSIEADGQNNEVVPIVININPLILHLGVGYRF